MPDPVVSLTYSDKEVRDRFAKLERKLSDLTPVMEDIGQFELLQHDRRFDREVDFRGNPLLANSPRTIAYKKATGKIQKILQSTGIMRSRTSYQATRYDVKITNNDSKARKHQLGIGVPKREIFGINPTEDVLEIINILEDYLAE